MDNKYELGGAKVATAHHDTHHEETVLHPTECRFCGANKLTLSPTMQDYLCNECGEWQKNVPQDYSTGRSTDY